MEKGTYLLAMSTARRSIAHGFPSSCSGRRTKRTRERIEVSASSRNFRRTIGCYVRHRCIETCSEESCRLSSSVEFRPAWSVRLQPTQGVARYYLLSILVENSNFVKNFRALSNFHVSSRGWRNERLEYQGETEAKEPREAEEALSSEKDGRVDSNSSITRITVFGGI